MSDAADKCPVDDKTRQKWLEAARAKGESRSPSPPLPAEHEAADQKTSGVILQAPSSRDLELRRKLQARDIIAARPDVHRTLHASGLTRYSLDTGAWEPLAHPELFLPRQLRQHAVATPPKPSTSPLPTSRQISSIPRGFNTPTQSLNSAERAALPSNSEDDTGHDTASGNWVYPSESQFYSAMRRKNHAARASDMATIVPIHNAVNERAWSEILRWEKGKDGEPRLVSFSGDSKKLTPRAWWNGTVRGWKRPFDRHDWVVERDGGAGRVEYVIDFYEGKGSEGGLGGTGALGFYLDVRPKVNSWEGVKMRMASAVGI